MGGVFKNIFGKKNESNETNQLLNEYKNIPWMTESRLDVLSICLKNGFKPASSLPTEFEKQLRTSIEIAKRLNAIKAIVLWLMVSKDKLPDKKIQYFIKTNELEVFLTEEEKLILMNSREDEDARNSIGWKFENAWSLAWYFGYDEPEIFGNMMSGEKMSEILMNFTCPLDEKIEEWIKTKKIVSEEMVLKKEDLFYCLHNAVRSAQLGRKTVPLNFDPIMNGGVIHERRHSLTWMVSKDIDWDETDLST
ncbi:DUF4272 domain-containing protein [Flavobacterium sp. U410]|jgi:hypothetical protein